jgi:hypothetical protein
MTTQLLDPVYFDGKRYLTSSEPLEHHPQLPAFLAITTSNHKGYEAIWSVVAEKLFLVALGGLIENSSARGLAMVFPGCMAPVFADWYSGQLEIQRGAVVKQYDYPLLEEQVTLTFQNGRVIAQERLRRELESERVNVDPILFSPISDIENLDKFVVSQLEAYGVRNLGDLAQMKASNLLRVADVNATSMRAIETGLAAHGLMLAMVLPGWRSE